MTQTATQLSEEAVKLASASDYIASHAERLIDLAKVHTLAGRRDGAFSALAQADALYARKGCIAMLKLTATRLSPPFEI